MDGKRMHRKSHAPPAAARLFPAARALGLLCLALCTGVARADQGITVTSPKGGETWDLGSAHAITWTSTVSKTGSPVVSLELLKDGNKVGDIATVPLTPASYPWKAGSFTGGTAGAGGGYKVRAKVLVSDLMVAQDKSDAAFTLRFPTVLRPIPAAERLAAIADLCRIVGCDPPAPVITDVLATGFHVEPGEDFVILGKDFGVPPGGTVKMVGPGLGTVTLGITGWHPTAIAVRVPDGLSGVTEQETKVHVETAAGASSNAWPVQFGPALDIVSLPDGSVRTLHCADPWACWDSCGPGVSGYHSTWCCFQGDISEDKFVIGPLRNGWVLNRRTIWTTSGANAALAQILHYNNGAGVNEPPDFPFGGIGWTPTVRWATGGVGQDIGYWVQVLVLGPRGTTP